MDGSLCDTCKNYVYDEEYERYVCMAEMDEDDVYRSLSSRSRTCPYYHSDDDYQIVRKQN